MAVVAFLATPRLTLPVTHYAVPSRRGIQNLPPLSRSSDLMSTTYDRSTTCEVVKTGMPSVY
jgi:hypothetical protein